jgi:tetrapyrrole methylase family protein/MazG family protein
MREELGDLLMHIALHAEIAAEENHFTFDDIVNELNEKIVRRHPHVFADKKAFTSDDVLKIWQQVKTQEKKERVVGKLFDGIPPEISALRYALDVAKKAPVEIVSETNANLNSTPEIEIGKELFDIVKKATQAKVEPEAALREYILQIRKTAEKNNL